MSIENIIRAWKAEEEDQNINAIANPIGEELTDQELREITGGLCSQLVSCAPGDTMFHCGTGSIQ